MTRPPRAKRKKLVRAVIEANLAALKEQDTEKYATEKQTAQVVLD